MSEVLYCIRTKTWTIAKTLAKAHGGESKGGKCYVVLRSTASIPEEGIVEVCHTVKSPSSIGAADIRKARDWVISRTMVDDLYEEHIRTAPHSVPKASEAAKRYFAARKNRLAAQKALDAAKAEEDKASYKSVVLNGRAPLSHGGFLWDPSSNGARCFYLKRRRQ